MATLRFATSRFRRRASSGALGGEPHDGAAAQPAHPELGCDQLVLLVVDDVFDTGLSLSEAARLVRESRRLRLLEASLYHDGAEIGRASALALATTEVTIPEAGRIPAGPPAVLREAWGKEPVIGVHSIPNRVNRKFPPGLHTLVPLKPAMLAMGSGRGTTWVQLPVDLIAGEPTTPLMRVAVLSDFSNGFAQLYLDSGTGFINADLTLNLHRLPDGDWLGIDAITRAQPNGIAIAEAELYDEAGLIGRVSQSNLTMATFGG